VGLRAGLDVMEKREIFDATGIQTPALNPELSRLLLVIKCIWLKGLLYKQQNLFTSMSSSEHKNRDIPKKKVIFVIVIVYSLNIESIIKQPGKKTPH
jgi:hypothetical protein